MLVVIAGLLHWLWPRWGNTPDVQVQPPMSIKACKMKTITKSYACMKCLKQALLSLIKQVLQNHCDQSPDAKYLHTIETADPEYLSEQRSMLQGNAEYKAY